VVKGIKLSLNHKEIAKILTGQTGNLTDILEAKATEIVGNTGKPASDYEIETWVGRSRVRVSILTKTRQAQINEATDHTLLRALGSSMGSDLQLYTSKSGKTSLRTAAEVANYTRKRDG
jgi:hypothetical protein